MMFYGQQYMERTQTIMVPVASVGLMPEGLAYNQLQVQGQYGVNLPAAGYGQHVGYGYQEAGRRYSLEDEAAKEGESSRREGRPAVGYHDRYEDFDDRPPGTYDDRRDMRLEDRERDRDW